MKRGEKIKWVKMQLLAGKSITSFQAIISVRYTRLASGINRLVNSGWDIRTIMKSRKDGTQYAEYKLHNIAEISQTLKQNNDK